MHDGESVGITERCNESEPVAQGGDEMIHPVGFASTRIIRFQYQIKRKQAAKHEQRSLLRMIMAGAEGIEKVYGIFASSSILPKFS